MRIVGLLIVLYIYISNDNLTTMLNNLVYKLGRF